MLTEIIGLGSAKLIKLMWFKTMTSAQLAVFAAIKSKIAFLSFPVLKTTIVAYSPVLIPLAITSYAGYQVYTKKYNKKTDDNDK